MKPIICVHALQQAGKTYLIDKIETILSVNSIESKRINIKSTFSPIVDMVKEYYSTLGYDLNEAQTKKLMLSQSTYGEMFVDENIWTNIWLKKVNSYPDVVLMDDCRTAYNLKGLLSLNRPVILFKLDVSEETRRKRAGDNWRDNGGYTEQLLNKPDTFPDSFKWYDLEENWDLRKIVNILENIDE